MIKYLRVMTLKFLNAFNYFSTVLKLFKNEETILQV
jgi:hypothetical protein